MCGVIGTLALGNLDKKEERIRQAAMRLISTELLQVTVDRGKEATGISTLFNNGDYMMLKMGISAPEFISRWGGSETDYDGYIKVWQKNTKPARVCIGHCRKPSTGGQAGPWDNNNNHPIRVNDIVGVHNGTLKNHAKIHRLLDVTPDGKVDSEAIFHLMDHFSEGGTRPWTTDMIKEICRRIEGQYCVLAYSGNNPHQLAVFRDGRPLEMCLVEPLNMVVLASERVFLNKAFFAWNKLAKLYGHDDYPILKAKNLDFAMMSDDTAIVFDLRRTVDEQLAKKKENIPASATVLIEDFFEKEKIPRADKIWDSGTTTTRTTSWSSTQKGNPKGTTIAGKTDDEVKGNKTEVNALPADKKGDDTNTGKDGKDKKPVGRVFCRALGEYQAEVTNDDTSKVSNVEVDPGDGEVMEIGTGKTIVEGEIDTAGAGDNDTNLSDMTLDESNEDSVLLDDPAKINEIAVETIKKEKKEKEDTATEGEEEAEGTTVEIDMTPDPEALEAANTASEQVQKYETVSEVADALETSPSSVAALPIHSLANRLKKLFYKFGFIEGFQAGKETDKSKAKPVNDKAIKQRKNIRILKNMMRTIIGMFYNVPSESRINEQIEEMFKAGHKMEGEVLDRLFSEGDRRKNQLISRVIDGVKKREQ